MIAFSFKPCPKHSLVMLPADAITTAETCPDCVLVHR